MTNEIRVGSGGGETKLTGMVFWITMLLYFVLRTTLPPKTVSTWAGSRWYLGYRGYQEIKHSHFAKLTSIIFNDISHHTSCISKKLDGTRLSQASCWLNLAHRIIQNADFALDSQHACEVVTHLSKSRFSKSVAL